MDDVNKDNASSLSFDGSSTGNMNDQNSENARFSRNGGTAPRRGVPSCPRLLDIEPNYRRFRNQNYHFPRSNGRNGVEASPQQHVNRNGNLDSKNRVMTNGNYPSRVLYSSTAKHGQGRTTARLSQSSQESNENEVNADNIHLSNGECSSNLLDGNMANSYKHDIPTLNGECASGGENSTLLGVSKDYSNSNYSKSVKKAEAGSLNGEIASGIAEGLSENVVVKGRNTKNSLKHFAKTPNATHSSEFEFNGNSNGFNIAERGAGLHLPELPSYRLGEAEMARFIANATGYNNRRFQEGHKDFNPIPEGLPESGVKPRNSKHSRNHFAKSPEARYSSEREGNCNSTLNEFNVAGRGVSVELPNYNLGEADLTRYIARTFEEGSRVTGVLIKGNAKNVEKHFMITPEAANSNGTVFNIAERYAGCELPELPRYRLGEARTARFVTNATEGSNRNFQERKDFTSTAAASPSLQLPHHPAYTNCSESMYSLPVGPQPNNNNARPDQKFPCSRESFASNAFELPRPVAAQNNANSSEAVANLPHTVTSGALHEEWANAPEFIPKSSRPRSYAEVVNPSHLNMGMKVCPYTERTGECRIPPGACPNMHGEICEFCGRVALHPTDILKRNAHIKKCRERQDRDMDMANAVARSKEKTCGICFEVVLEKQMHERRFGILTQCNHCFCLSCIRKWRQARQFENKVVRACPECRVTSDFVCPSSYWVDTKEDKDKLINNYKSALAEKQCKYFKQGRGRCPFGNKCFYLHALPDGTKTDVGPPPRRRRPRNRYPDDGELGDMLQQIILWDFLDEHDHHWLYSFADDIDEWVAFFSDSDESESWSEYECLFE